MYRVCKVEDADSLASALAVRQKVFVEEQGVSPEIEYDGHDAECAHVLAWHGNEPVGAGRLMPLGSGEFKIGRMAVLPAHRGKGVGGRLLTALLEIAAQSGARKAILHAQSHAIPFYERYGFSVTSPEFLEAGIRHVCMEAYPMAKHVGEGAKG